jgi:hypothetical protein
LFVQQCEDVFHEHSLLTQVLDLWGKPTNALQEVDAAVGADFLLESCCERSEVSSA